MTRSHDERRQDRQLMADVRDRVWKWDPIGLAEMDAPEDEYDCLVGPITSALVRGASARELAQTLQTHIADHFGVEPVGTPTFSDDLVRWHSASSADA